MFFDELLLTVQAVFPKDLKLLEQLKSSNLPKQISRNDLEQIIKNLIKVNKLWNFYSNDFSKLKNLLKERKIKLLYINDNSYPFLLKKEFGSPLVLFYKGDIDVLNSKTVSIVGTRKPTLYGRRYARLFSEELSSCGITIISGMARGIDTEAHKGALKAGKTAAVLGSGLLKIYPASNRELFRKILDKGCVISEFSPLYPTLSSNFPIRNRIIAYLSPVTLVIEAKKKSGSLITAYLANDAGRDVAAIPSNIDSKNSEGTNLLIKKGGYLIQKPEDILMILPYKVNRKEKVKVTLSKKEKEVLKVIPSDREISFDEIIEKMEISIGDLFHILLNLEIKGVIEKIQGNNYRRIEFL